MEKVLLFVFTIPLLSFSQNWKAAKIDLDLTESKRYAMPLSAVFLSGVFDGTNQAIWHHYDSGFKRRFPNANDMFCNPRLSHVNKYENGDPAQGPKFFGSTTFLVWTTDLYHITRTADRAAVGFALVTWPDKKNRKKMLRDMLIFTAVRAAGFHLSYSLILKSN